MPTSIILTDSETDLSHAIDLMSIVGLDGVFAVSDSLKAPPPKESDETRTVTLELAFRGGSSISLEERRRDVVRLFGLAPRATGAKRGAWTGNPIVLLVKERESPNYVAFDVLMGDLDAKQRDFGSSNFTVWTFSLTCLPYARGPAVLLQDWTSTITNGLNSKLYLSSIPGDTYALATVEFKDVSTSGKALNAVLMGMRGYRYMASGDYTPVIASTVTGAGSSNANTNAINGTNEVRLTSSTDWQSVAMITGGGSGLNYGQTRVLIHYRVSTSILGSPTNLKGVPSATGGSLGAGAWIIMVSEVDGSGKETLTSDPVTVVIPGSGTAGSIALTWTPIGSPANHKVYVRSAVAVSGAFSSHLTGSSAGSYSFTTTASWTTPAVPPATTDPALVTPELRCRVALNVASPVWSPPGQPFSPNVGGNLYEYGEAGVWPLPPLPRQEGQADQPWAILVEARIQGTTTPTVDVDGAWLMSFDEGDWQTYAAIPGKANSTLSRLVIDSRRDGRMSGLITNTAGNTNLGSFVPRGWFALPYGAALLCFAAEAQNGEANTVDLKYQVRVTARPRYLDVIGLVS